MSSVILNPIQKSVIKSAMPYVKKRNNGNVFSVNASNEHSNIIKSISDEEREVHLIGNAYYYFDSDEDVLFKGCASKSISERGVNSTGNRKIKFALQHNIRDLTGSYKYLADTDIGIEAKVNIYPDTDTLGRETWLRYKTGDYTEHSVGFSYMMYKWLDINSEGFKRLIGKVINKDEAILNGGFFAVTEIDLYEISTVTFGANEYSGVLGLKSADYNPKTYAQKCKNFWDLVHSDLAKGVKAEDYIKEIQRKQYDAIIKEETLFLQFNKGVKPSDDTSNKQKPLQNTFDNKKTSIGLLL